MLVTCFSTARSVTTSSSAIAWLVRPSAIVRAVLLPATMKLLADWNWYLPSWLGWMPHVGREPEPEGAAA
jgi:hypothetical protein